MTAVVSLCCGHCGKVAAAPLPAERLADLPRVVAAFRWIHNEQGTFCCAECAARGRR